MKHMIELTILNALVIYALTFLFTQSHIFSWVRTPLARWLDKVWGPERYKFEECRMCVGFWVTLFLGLLAWAVGPNPPSALLLMAAYGLSYFLATQER